MPNPAPASHRLLFFASALATACSSPSCSAPASPGVTYGGAPASASRQADADMIPIPAGPFVKGSSLDEREQAYADYRQTAGHDAARRGRWFEREPEPHQVTLAAYVIDKAPVTNAAYAEFVRDTGRSGPTIDKAAWEAQRFAQHYEREVRRFNWDGQTPPAGRGDHPVLLVTWSEARDYCAWRGAAVGAERHLPTADEYEKAARGTDGMVYPWGGQWDASKLNSGLTEPRDTTPVGSYPQGASPFGMLDAAGNVFEWTSTVWPFKPNAATVKGSAWEDYAGVGRGASAHGRPKTIRHAIVGFRCAGR